MDYPRTLTCTLFSQLAILHNSRRLQTHKKLILLVLITLEIKGSIRSFEVLVFIGLQDSMSTAAFQLPVARNTITNTLHKQ